MNIHDLLMEAVARLAASGSTSPRLDAEVLLMSFLEVDRLELCKAPDRLLTKEEQAGFEEWLKRRCLGEPVAYIVGEKEFWSLAFKVDRRVLIPRPETEVLVEEALLAVRQSSHPLRNILEIGVGSGAISIALAREVPQVRLVAVDISAAALAVARENARLHGVEPAIDFLCGDCFKPVRGVFDMIVSNPPYISPAEFSRLSRSVKDFEPPGALLAAGTGTACHEVIIAASGDFLREGGWLILEMGEGQGGEIACLFQESGIYEQVSVRCDYGGRERVIKARKAGRIG